MRPAGQAGWKAAWELRDRACPGRPLDQVGGMVAETAIKNMQFA
ncbi:MAG: hypothetical protein Q7T62_00880 [Undibacterium sp.]|nr:hypothetical protein [Undibacterium sp.]